MTTSIPRRSCAALVRGAAASALSAALLLLPAQPLAAEEGGEIQGRIVADAGGAPLAGVAVQVAGTSLAVLSDAEGRFRIAPLRAGAYEIVARHESFGAQRRVVRLDAGGSAEVEFRLAGSLERFAGAAQLRAIRQPSGTVPAFRALEDVVPEPWAGFFGATVSDARARGPSVAPSAEMYLEGGSFGSNRVLLSGSASRGRDGVRADLDLTRSSGWREGAWSDRQGGSVRWEHRFADGITLRTVAAGVNVNQQTDGASTLLRDDYRSNPQLNYAPISLRNERALRLSTTAEKEAEATLYSVTPYLRWSSQEILPSASLNFDPTIYTTGRSSAGVLAKVRHDLAPLRTRLHAGMDFEYSSGGRLEHRIALARTGEVFTCYARGSALYDYDVSSHALSPYLQAEVNPTQRLQLTAGLRYDRMGYDYRSRLDPQQSGRWRRPEDTQLSYDRLSPQLGAAYEVSPALTLYASRTQSFRAPAEAHLFRQGQAASTLDLRPVTASTSEAGVRGELRDRFGYSLGAYRTTLANDIRSYILPDGARETQNVGETIHRGIELSLSAALTPRLRADVGYSWARHGYLGWRPREEVDYSGNAVEAVPDLLLNGRLSYAPASLAGSRFALEWNRVGGQWLDAGNTHRYPGHDLFHLQASLPLSRDFEVTGRVMNLADTRHAEGVAYTQARGEEFAPGMPRTVYVGLQYRWHGGKAPVR